jgi:hypothetical protein
MSRPAELTPVVIVGVVRPSPESDSVTTIYGDGVDVPGWPDGTL